MKIDEIRVMKENCVMRLPSEIVFLFNKRISVLFINLFHENISTLSLTKTLHVPNERERKIQPSLSIFSLILIFFVKNTG